MKHFIMEYMVDKTINYYCVPVCKYQGEIQRVLQRAECDLTECDIHIIKWLATIKSPHLPDYLYELMVVFWLNNPPVDYPHSHQDWERPHETL